MKEGGGLYEVGKGGFGLFKVPITGFLHEIKSQLTKNVQSNKNFLKKVETCSNLTTMMTEQRNGLVPVFLLLTLGFIQKTYTLTVIKVPKLAL